MNSISKFFQISFFSLFFILLNQLSVFANPLDSINRTLRDLNSTIDQINGTSRTSSNTLNNLNKLLGVSNNEENTPKNAIDGVLDTYQKWYKKLSPSEQQIVSSFTMEYASKGNISFETIASSDWFLEENLQEQQKIGALFFKFNEVVKAVGSDKDKFLAYAFCINSGSSECSVGGK